ncbi:MAG TPA: chromosomal replication initiator protein DnaA [Solirubrobacteraceae bacterium]
MSLSAHLEPNVAWREFRAELRRAVSESTYEIWLAALELKSVRDGTMVVDVPAATHEWVSKRFGRILESCARIAVGPDVTLELVCHGTDRPHRPTTQTETVDLAATALNPRYSFEQFIIGDGNRLAHAASLAVAELPGQAYNPLFLHGPPGLGKTHLLHAIGNYVLSFGGGAVVRYTTVEAFTNHFIQALGSRSLDRFKQAYRNADVLLIDDVQFLASKVKTEEEFFHTFNALYETGRQLVLTCDRLPRQLLSVEERLRERFEAGLVAVIKPPDFATRVAILRKRAALDHIPVTDGAVLELIAERITDNVRLLEGALIRIVAYHSLTQMPIDIRLATTVLDEIHPRTAASASASVDEIQHAVASYYGLALAQLISSSRAASVSWPRQVAIHLTRALTDASLQTIGEAFGGRNHTTVLHACKRVNERMGADQQAVHEVEELTGIIGRSRSDRSS